MDRVRRTGVNGVVRRLGEHVREDEDRDLRIRRFGPDRLEKFERVALLVNDIHQHDVGLFFREELRGLPEIPRAEDGEVARRELVLIDLEQELVI